MAASVSDWRLRLAAVAAGLVALHLGGEWSQGGGQSHHFLADAPMPAFSVFPCSSRSGAALSFAVHRGLVPGLGYAWRRLRGHR